MVDIDAKKKLDQIAEFKSQLDVLMLEKQKILDEVIGEEIMNKVADVEIEFSGKCDAVNENIAKLETEVKNIVLAAGETLDGTLLQAVYMKGRVTWDTKQLEGLMIVMPELTQARKQGDPSVQIRSKK